MKYQRKKCMPSRCFLFAFFTFVGLLFHPFHSDAEEKTDYEIQASLQKLVNRAVHLTEDAVDVEKHTSRWPEPQFRNKWSRRTYEMHSIKVRVQKTQGDISGALKSYRDSFTVMSRLAASDPKNT